MDALSSAAKYIGTIVPILALIGFHYLEIYHGYFGNASEAAAAADRKLLVRALYFIFGSWRIIGLLALIVVGVALAGLGFHFRLFGLKLSKYLVLAPLMGVLLWALAVTVRAEALRVVALELDPATTSLRELRCLASAIPATQSWYDDMRREHDKVLIALRSGEALHVFYPPARFDLGTPFVDIIKLGVSNEDIVVDRRASMAARQFPDSASCGR